MYFDINSSLSQKSCGKSHQQLREDHFTNGRDILTLCNYHTFERVLTIISVLVFTVHVDEWANIYDSSPLISL